MKSAPPYRDQPLETVVCSFLGVGCVPRGPATLAAITGAAIYYLLHPNVIVQTLLVAAALLAGLHFSRRILAVCEDRDPQFIVIDEVVGVWVALFALPLDNILFVGLAAALFRILDKTKPGFVRVLDRLRGSPGLMMDDLAAGVLTNMILRIARVLYAQIT